MSAPSLAVSSQYGEPMRAPRVSVHNGADEIDQSMRRWNPPLQSFDQSYLPERDKLVSRTQDLVRESPMLASGIRSQIYKMVGDYYRMSYKPDYALTGLSVSEAARFIESVERQFRMDAEDDENWFDASGRMSFTELVSCALYGHYTQGEALLVSEFLERQKRAGDRPFATSFSVINPDRVVTPPMEQEGKNLRAGFRMTNKGYAFGLFLLNRHPGDMLFGGFSPDAYQYITRHTPWGRPKWRHIFVAEAPDQMRGRAQLVSGIKHARMLERFESAALSNAITQSLYAAVVQSSDPATAFQGLMQNDPMQQYKKLVDAKLQFYGDENELEMNNAAVAHMFPGDEFKFMASGQNLDTFDPFQAAFLRQLASLLDISYEELSGDYTKTNYSGARAGELNSSTGRRATAARVPSPTARYMATNWLEEQCSLGRVAGVPGRTSRARLNWFLNNKQALCRFRFYGPGTSHIDPEKGTKAAENELRFGGSTLEDYYNTYTNRDWREGVDQLALEAEYARSKNVLVGAEAVQQPKAQAAPQASISQADSAGNEINE